MPCKPDHFISLLDELRARPDPELPPPTVEHTAGRNWGGRRPGAGAKKSNTNALKHGRFSVRHRRLIQALAAIPDVRDALEQLGARHRKQQRLAEAGAAEVIAQLFQRAGEAILHPDHQTGNHQEFLDFLRTTEKALLFLSEKQSTEPQKHSRPRKHRDSTSPPAPQDPDSPSPAPAGESLP